MRSWGDSTPGLAASGIKLVADGNGDYTDALGLLVDKTGSRMGKRSKRFAAILEYGEIKSIQIDSIL